MSAINDRIGAIIVSFNPDERLVTNCRRLLPQVDVVTVIDNGSVAGVRHLKRVATLPRTAVILNGRNIGLAAALNVGVRAAVMRCQMLLTFDQDSIAPPTYVTDLMTAYHGYHGAAPVAIVSPQYRDQATGAMQTFSDCGHTPDCPYALVTTTITSGSMFVTSVFGEVGMFREDFFIDYVDNEFCLRCRKRGYAILEASRAVLSHSVGAPRQYRLLWKRPLASNHAPWRRYYITRNRLIVYRGYLTSFPRWVIADCFRMLKELIKIAVYERRRSDQYKWMLRGLRDAIRNAMGPIPQVP